MQQLRKGSTVMSERGRQTPERTLYVPLMCEWPTCKETSETDKSVRTRYKRVKPSGEIISFILCDKHNKEV